MTKYPQMLHTAIDATDARQLAEFYRELLGLRYRPGDRPPADATPDDADWLVLVDAQGTRKLAFQRVNSLARAAWPASDVPMQMHVDFSVPSVSELERHRGPRPSAPRCCSTASVTPNEPLYVLADPAGHPFCVLVA